MAPPGLGRSWASARPPGIQRGRVLQRELWGSALVCWPPSQDFPILSPRADLVTANTSGTWPRSLRNTPSTAQSEIGEGSRLLPPFHTGSARDQGHPQARLCRERWEMKLKISSGKYKVLFLPCVGGSRRARGHCVGEATAGAEVHDPRGCRHPPSPRGPAPDGHMQHSKQASSLLPGDWADVTPGTVTPGPSRAGDRRGIRWQKEVGAPQGRGQMCPEREAKLNFNSGHPHTHRHQGSFLSAPITHSPHAREPPCRGNTTPAGIPGHPLAPWQDARLLG